MKIRRVISIDYGHTLPLHLGFCNQIHGHRATVICEFEGEINKDGASRGMVVDFSVCKQLMMDTIHKQLDHGFAIWNNMDEDIVKINVPCGNIAVIMDVKTEQVAIPLMEIIKVRNSKILSCDEPPTAEYLAKYFFRAIVVEMAYKLPVQNKIIITRIEWWETPNNVAIYTADDYKKT